MIEILDTTLRDGLQGYNINYSLDDRLQIVNILRKLNLTIEIGNPAAGEPDKTLINTVSNGNDLVVFGSTLRKGCTVDKDQQLVYLAAQPIERVCIFGKASISHAVNILGISAEDNLSLIADSITYLRNKGKRVIFDAEHFYDGYNINPEYSLKVIITAYNSGAEVIVLCDTNGGSLPEDIYSSTHAVVSALPSAIIGIHCHNDGGLAVANSIAAMKAGAKHFQGTLLGFGERCGNTSISTLIPTLELKYNLTTPCHSKIHLLTEQSHKLAEITNIALDPTAPYIGSSAFYHKAGMHIDAIIKNKESFEHISPSLIGNTDSLLVSQLVGKNALNAKLQELLPGENCTANQLNELLTVLKCKETEGYSYESAEASFILLASNFINAHKQFFELLSYKVITDNSAKNSAIIKISVDGNNSLACGEGVGPVHALDSALRGALIRFYPSIKKISLTDYKVRVLDSNGATGAKVRVLITTASGKGKSWSTVGVSGDIIEASFIALSDSINYWLANC